MKIDKRFEMVDCRCCRPPRRMQRQSIPAHEQAVRAKRGTIEERRAVARSDRAAREQGEHNRRPRPYGAPMRW